MCFLEFFFLGRGYCRQGVSFCGRVVQGFVFRIVERQKGGKGEGGQKKGHDVIRDKTGLVQSDCS